MKKTVESQLIVNEIFYSLQGEGARAGEPSIFIRLTGCSAKNACYKSGVVCDTEFESGMDMTIREILDWIYANGKGCNWIVWTGGEPCDQLTEEIVEYFKTIGGDEGFSQAIETSGIKRPPSNLDYICLSPKVAEHTILKKWKGIFLNELRWVRSVGQAIPNTKLHADNYYLSPHSDGFTISRANVEHCIDLCLANPRWRLSLQQHKIWNVR